MKKFLILLAVIMLLTGCAPRDTSVPASEAEVTSEIAGNVEPPEVSAQASAEAEVTSEIAENVEPPEVSAQTSADEGDIVYIGERFFVTEINHIWLNREQYLGRVIQYEGMFFSVQWEDESVYFVARYTLGCCGPDGLIGFDVSLNDVPAFPDNTWVQVTGVLEEDYSEWGSILMVNATSIIEMPERGREFVTQ